MTFLCRDCLATDAGGPQQCPQCGSDRVVSHPELDSLMLAHVDCDAFYAAVEKRDDPELRDRPVIVGGGRRGVVATACYVARRYGVRSAMPMFEARDRCPNAVVIKPNMDKYKAVAEEIRQLFDALTPLVEPISIDEAYLDLTGTATMHHASPAKMLAALSQQVEQEIGVTLSIGLSHNKLLAKIASDLDKPRGFSAVGRAEAREFLAPMPVRVLPGVGPVMERKLKQIDLCTVGDIAQAAPDQFATWGAAGRRLLAQAAGEDERVVTPEQEARSVSAELTLDANERDVDRLQIVLRQLVDNLSRRLRRQNLAGRVVFLKLRTAQFQLLTRQKSCPVPVQSETELLSLVAPLLQREADGRYFRLVGVGVRELSEPVADDGEGSLFDLPEQGDKVLDDIVDQVRGRYGESAIQRGILPREKFTPQGPTKN